MANLRRLGDLAGLLLTSHLQRKRDTYQAELDLARQQQMAEMNFANTVLGRLAQDPSMASRTRDAGVSEIGGMPIDIFVPSPEEALGSVGRDITEHPDQFDPLSIIGRYGSQPGALKGPDARPPIEQLIQARNAALERRRMTAPPQMVTEMRDDGSTFQQAVNPYQLPEEGIRTGLGGAQEGQNELENWMANEGSALRQNAAVRQAGREAGARQSAQLAAEGQFYTSAAGRALLKAKADAALSETQSQEEARAIVDAARKTANFMPSIIELEKKWQQAKPEIQRLVQSGAWSQEIEAFLTPQWDEAGRTFVARGIQALPLTVQQTLSPTVRQYFEMRQSYMPVFARVLGEVGNLNEQEQMRAVGLAPSALDALGDGASGDEKLGRLKRLMINAPDIVRANIRAVHGGATTEERELLIRGILGTDDALPADQPAAPPSRALQKLNQLRSR